MRNSMRPDDGVVHNGHNGTTDTYDKDATLEHEPYLSDDTASDFSEKQAGVKRIEAVSKAWTKASLIIAYVTYVQLLILQYES